MHPVTVQMAEENSNSKPVPNEMTLRVLECTDGTMCQPTIQ